MQQSGVVPNINITGAALLRNVLWYAAVRNTAIGGIEVHTSPSWTAGSFTNRTGNLSSGIFVGGSPFVAGIEPDPTVLP